MRSDKKNQLLLRRYIRESLTLEIGLGDVVTGIKKATIGDDDFFTSFIKRQLSKIDAVAGHWVDSKLNSVLPKSVKDKIDKYAEESFGEESSTILAGVISGWFEEAKKAGKNFSKDEQEEISEFATIEFANQLKGDFDISKVIKTTKQKLDQKYGKKSS